MIKSERRFADTILFEITAAWDQELGSFVATGHARRGGLRFEIGGPGRYPTITDFRAGLSAEGVTISALDLSHLEADREMALAQAAREKTTS